MRTGRAILVFTAAALWAAPARAKDQVVAKVNGSSIKQSDVYRRLWNLKGVEMLDSLIDRKLIELACCSCHVLHDCRFLGMPSPLLSTQCGSIPSSPRSCRNCSGF